MFYYYERLWKFIDRVTFYDEYAASQVKGKYLHHGGNAGKQVITLLLFSLIQTLLAIVISGVTKYTAAEGFNTESANVWPRERTRGTDTLPIATGALE